MSDPFVGEIRLFGFTFAPRGWALCHGQLLPITQHTALFSLLGTLYGGDGRTTFALPDLRGRTVVGSGQGPGLANHRQGAAGGAEAVALTIDQLPAHRHEVTASRRRGRSRNPAGRFLARSRRGRLYDAQHAETMHVEMITEVGGGLPHDNLPPYLPLSWCIALEGIFPSRS
ncbi:phage tail protein [Nocardioides coralli]|uniref:phage tail protein n=1 Tax=Nocardioides coralli TaxID=2872154 RepID=UPI001CA43B7A|nr:tail fiber protein [Nocardioides coralli]QZY29598.1 tail fiber protein [Nocardioides coralli]